MVLRLYTLDLEAFGREGPRPGRWEDGSAEITDAICSGLRRRLWQPSVPRNAARLVRERVAMQKLKVKALTVLRLARLDPGAWLLGISQGAPIAAKRFLQIVETSSSSFEVHDLVMDIASGARGRSIYDHWHLEAGHPSNLSS